MRVVFVNRIAWPDEGATAIYVTEAAEALAAAGHETHVVAGEAGYRLAGRARRAPRLRRGVRYHRLPGRRGERLLERGLGAARFLARASARLLSLPRPDVVVALTDPPFLDGVATLVARLRGARAVAWLMDVYPEVATAAGVLRRGSAVERALARAHAFALRRASAVVVLGRAMRRPALERGVARRRLRVIENWAPAEVEAAAGAAAAGAAPARPLTLLYSGTCGRGHDLAPLFAALAPLPADAPVRVVFQAAGTRLAEVREQAGALRLPVEFRPPVPRERLAASLLEGDLHVVSVRAGYERLLVPSKVYAPLRLGLPLLVTGPRASEPARLLRRGAPGAHLDDLAGDGDLVARLRAVARERRAAPARSGPDRWVAALEALVPRRAEPRS
jgi:glycosyltransferase involved in cell wall biosynthesis